MTNDTSRPSLTTIARHLGVSPKTVSNAFRRPDQLSPALRQRILAHAAEVGYTGPDPLARAFRKGSSRLVGVVYGNRLSYAFDDGAYVTFLAGVAEVLEEAGFGITLLPAAAQGEERSLAVRDAVMDAAIVYSLSREDVAIDHLTARGIPIVTVDQPRLADVPWVGIDDREAMRFLTRHLRDLGHSRIGVVSFAINRHAGGEIVMLDQLPEQTLDVTSARLAGIANVLGDRVADVPVVHLFGSSEAVGREGARVLLREFPDLSAWMFLGDRMAIGGIEVARDAGLAVPQRLSITGFDYAVPGSGLTTVRQPHREKGIAAAHALLSLLRGEDPPSDASLPVDFIVGETTASVSGHS